MKRTTNAGVVAAWKRGVEAKNSRNTLHTDGTRLYSYLLHIGMRSASGDTVLADYTASGSYRSQTTSCHIGIARRSGVDLMMHPKVWQLSLLRRDYK
jgi:hypothetical protein